MWSFLKQKINKAIPTTQVSLLLQDDHLLLMAGQATEQNKLRIDTLTAAPYKEKNLANVLPELVKKHSLQHATTTVILPPSRFQLFSLDALPLPEKEIHAALRWRLKDLLDYPVEQACWDFFQIPTLDARNYILTVIVVNQPWLLEQINIITSTSLSVKTVTISFFALRNLLSHDPQIEQGIALLYEDINTLRILFLKNGDLNLIRQLNTSYAACAPNDALDTIKAEELVLFLQRSLDFYQSQLHQSPPIKLLTTTSSAPLLNYLSQNLTCKIETLDMKLWLDNDSAITSFKDEEIISASGLYPPIHHD